VYQRATGKKLGSLPDVNADCSLILADLENWRTAFSRATNREVIIL